MVTWGAVTRRWRDVCVTSQGSAARWVDVGVEKGIVSGQRDLGHSCPGSFGFPGSGYLNFPCWAFNHGRHKPL